MIDNKTNTQVSNEVVINITEPELNERINLFKDKSIAVLLKIFSIPDSVNEKNTILSVNALCGGVYKTTMSDTVYCWNNHFEIKNFNNDSLDDLLILHESSTRSCSYFYLYITDNKNNSLIKVRGFEEIPSPMLIDSTGIICGMGLYGDKVDYSFYRINENDSLINLGHDFVDDIGYDDDTDFDDTLKLILKEQNRRK